MLIFRAKPNVIQKMAKPIVSLLLVFVLFSFSVTCAYGYEDKYLVDSSWTDDFIQTKSIDVDGAYGELSGAMLYFVKDNCAYFNFRVKEDSLRTSNKVQYEFYIDAQGASYELTVDKDGLVSPSDLDTKIVDVATSFYAPTSQGVGIHITAIDINDKIYTHSFSIFAVINGHRYFVVDSLDLDIGQEPATKQSKESTTKSSKENTTKSDSSKNSSDNTTSKYKYDGASTTKYGYQDSEENSMSNFSDVIANASEKKHMSSFAIGILSLGISLGAIGIALIVSAIIRNNVNKKKKVSSAEIKEDEIDDFEF